MKGTWGGTPFNELAPGAIDRECTYFAAGRCENDDDCPFKHKGREKEQEAKPLAMEQKKKADDSVPVEDSRGLPKKRLILLSLCQECKKRHL